MKGSVLESTFDAYTVAGVIGQGGSGVVYEATNTSGEIVAVKCLAHETVTTSRKKRFRNEIAFCLRNEHPNIVRVLDHGNSAIGGRAVTFYVMARYKGTLRSQMHKLAPDDRLEAFAQIINGVDAAHKQSVWHRDLKPENILYDPTLDKYVIADFGIAHFCADALHTAVETRLTDKLANFQYAAPEQRQRGAVVDHRADLFALGLLLNELFTNVVPHGAGYKKIAEIESRFAYLDSLVESLIQHDPDKRPASIEAVQGLLLHHKVSAAALQKLDALRNQVVPIDSPSMFEPLRPINVTYDDGAIVIQLNRRVPPEWGHFLREGQHGRHLTQHPPTSYLVRDSVVCVPLQRPNLELGQLVYDMAKQHIDSANTFYRRHLNELAARVADEKRKQIEREVAANELKLAFAQSLKV